MKKHNGFTFIELLVVITIVAMVFAAGVVSYTTISKNSRNARRRADLEAIRQSLEMCRTIAGEYPPADQIYDNVTCTDTASTVTLKNTPKDPKPCEGYLDGHYSYVLNTTYTLTANCMEDDPEHAIVTSP